MSNDSGGFAAGDFDLDGAMAILDVNIHLKGFVGRSCLAEEDGATSVISDSGATGSCPSGRPE